MSLAMDYSFDQQQSKDLTMPLSRDSLLSLDESKISAPLEPQPQDDDLMEMVDPLLTATSSSSSSDIDPEERIDLGQTAATTSQDIVSSTPSTTATTTSSSQDIQMATIAAAPEEVAQATSAAESTSSPTTAAATMATEPSQTHVVEETPVASAASFSFANNGQENVDKEETPEPPKPLSRPLSRQDLRRKSSFFNNKEIVINPQRYSATTFSSLRPIADPRFKNRFQNLLSQWKARDSN
ncbi:hypothetical protein BGZ94_008111 [Podila epigama]|nr:hypothetical protein BGZ94_008111 [Podila epigama]